MRSQQEQDLESRNAGLERKLEIEAALERTRVQSMLMQHSAELDDTLRVFHQQVLLLGICSAFSFLWLPDEDRDRHIFWAAWAENNSKDFKSKAIDYPLDRKEPATAQCLVDWKGSDPVVSYHVPPEGVESYFAAWEELIAGVKQLKPRYFRDGLYYVEAFMKYGCFGVMVEKTLSPEEQETLGRFAIEFERAYTRFLDLQKAEAQAREAQVELALERVRARTMAMYHSEELAETCSVLFEQLSELGSEPARISIGIMDEEKGLVNFWATDQEGDQINISFTARVSEKTTLRKMYAGWQAKLKSLSIELEGKELADWVSFCRDEMGIIIKDELLQKRRVHTVGYFSQGWINYTTHTLPSSETKQILERFATMFGYTYTRFLDLQKAEAQAREAKIETSLERVRAAAMAMHNSDDVGNATALVFSELHKLSIITIRCGVCIINGATQQMEVWSATSSQEGEVNRGAGKLDMNAHPLWTHLWNAWKRKESSFTYELTGKELADYYKAIMNSPGYHVAGSSALNTLDDAANTKQYCNCFLFNEGCVFTFTQVPFSPEISQVLKKFTAVFGLTYRRYLDLQNAEAQAREAQIEAALEKVRSRSLAMHQTEELREVVSVVFEKLHDLGIVMDEEAASIVIFTEGTKDLILWNAIPDQLYSKSFNIPYYDTPVITSLLDAKNEGADFFERNYTPEEKSHFWEWAVQYSDYKNIPDERKQRILSAPYFACSIAYTKNSAVMVSSYKGKLLSEKEGEILKRFARVFEQAYVRFLDLHRAEEQAREAKIEAALERIRAVAMSMMKSDELLKVCESVFTQLQILGFPELRNAQIFIKYDEKGKFLNYNYSDYQGTEVVEILYDSHPKVREFYNTLQTGDDAFAQSKYTGDDLEDIKLYFNETLGQKKDPKLDDATEVNYYFYSVGTGALGISTFQPIGDDELKILKRFRNVFSLSYQRYADMAMAEAQAREAQIELALERVRAKTMAMHTSEDVSDTVNTLFAEVRKLGVKESIRCGVSIIHDTRQMELWTASSTSDGEPTLIKGHLSIDIHPLLQRIFDAWKHKKQNTTYELVGDDLTNYYNALIASPDYPFQFKVESLPSKQINNAFFFPEGCLFAFTVEPLSEDANKLFNRFAGVFGLTYRRYLDLQKAETQARESQIQLALERVRARTMAMQKSEELHEVIQVIFEQLQQLNFNIDNANFTLNYQDTDDLDLWLAVAGAQYPTKIYVPYISHPLFNRFNKAKANAGLYTDTLSFREKNSFFEHLFKYTPTVPKERKAFIFDQPGFARSAVFMKNTVLTIINYQGTPYSEAENNTLLRFGQVFDQTYTRFNDLKLAEEQARESKIEAALEKVRGKALAMYNSTDLTSTASLVFTELRKLGIDPVRCGVGMMNKGSLKVALYSAATSAEGDSLGLLGWVMLAGHPVLDKIYDSLLSGEDYFPVLKGKQLKAYYEKLLSGLSLPSLPDFHAGKEQFGHFFPFTDGCLYAWAERRYDDTEVRVLRRFASVIDLTFRRYIELQKSEASARDAVRAASLDRVRAEIASMRSTGDLDRITPLIWNELTILGIPFIRCGVFIVDEQKQLIHSHLSTSDGQALATFDLPFDSDGITPNVLLAWRNKQVARVHWSAEEFAAYTQNLVNQGRVGSEERYVTEHPDTSLDLHFMPFLQGLLYVGNITPLTENELELVQSLADAFSTAYARYEDFNKLEAAKRQVEHTLNDLKAAQTKLIQSEKMASLGELTAGIAHEIQNPLNFVNNFSDVSIELVDEMLEELDKGDKEEVIAISDDIKQNLEKIRHHGKRADGIVKGMLQHSRTSGGEKQPTNINTLADEFLRLSYHGLRAKDKEFNAELITNFDPALPKIDVIPQDIGRVLINLFNNAFYAVQQKAKTAERGYKPTVEITSFYLPLQGMGGLSVKDNGTGMPEHIKEKIMQPFFTTKPTGEGTGLGLSLTYDMVVKGHGGSIEVNSTEGEGSEFIIKLPILT